MSINPRSLENLKKPKKKRKYGHMYAVPQETIDELFKHITDGISLKEAAKRVDICYDTAKKYYEKGDERRGMRPLKVRLQIFQDSVSKEFDVKLVERRKHLLDVIVKAIDQMEEAIEAKILTKKSSYAQFASLIKLEMYLRGGSVERIEKTIFSAEQIRELSEGS